MGAPFMCLTALVTETGPVRCVRVGDEKGKNRLDGRAEANVGASKRQLS